MALSAAAPFVLFFGAMYARDVIGLGVGTYALIPSIVLAQVLLCLCAGRRVVARKVEWRGITMMAGVLTFLVGLPLAAFVMLQLASRIVHDPRLDPSVFVMPAVVMALFLSPVAALLGFIGGWCANRHQNGHKVSA